MDNIKLMHLAKLAAKNSYSPYSKFSVGAALLCSDGAVYTGCNVENVSFSATNCAERTAVFSAIADGKREFVKIAVAAYNRDGQIVSTPPCGVCRQVLCEFCKRDFKVIINEGELIVEKELASLMPLAFKKF